MNKFAVLASATAAIATAATTLADPLLTITASVGGYAPSTTTSNGTATATAGTYSYIGGMMSSFPADWFISWDLVGEDSLVYPNTSFLTNGFRVQNLTSAAKTFDITVNFAAPGGSNLTLEGRALLGGTLNSDVAGSAATLTSSGALWTGQINGVSRTASALMNNANLSAVGSTTFGPLSSTSTGLVTGPLTSVGYRMQFTLGAKSTAVFSGYWEVVPGPSALAMFGVAFGLGSRRRRTA